MRPGLIPGYNVDKLNIEAGMAELIACGYDERYVETHNVIHFALQRWIRGEEVAAQRMAIDSTFHGIDLTSWYRVLAAAKSKAGL